MQSYATATTLPLRTNLFNSYVINNHCELHVAHYGARTIHFTHMFNIVYMFCFYQWQRVIEFGKHKTIVTHARLIRLYSNIQGKK